MKILRSVLFVAALALGMVQPALSHTEIQGCLLVIPLDSPGLPVEWKVPDALLTCPEGMPESVPPEPASGTPTL